MSSNNFKSISRALRRNHITVLPNGLGGHSMFTKVKSSKSNSNASPKRLKPI
jgi:hypothetical protein